ncbi:MAG: helix-hairpin-helix domain-containing protein [Phycisphaeraceae bacterium]|nr:helix-hairpin-helix domain-containing protein [Phycisphaeraceae bacterium]
MPPPPEVIPQVTPPAEANRSTDQLSLRLWVAAFVIFLLALTAGWWWTHPVRRGTLEPHSAALRIDINTADAGDLELLPGLGPQLAQRIVEYRSRHGAFTGSDDLQQVSGIGPRIMADLEPWIVFGPGQ